MNQEKSVQAKWHYIPSKQSPAKSCAFCHRSGSHSVPFARCRCLLMSVTKNCSALWEQFSLCRDFSSVCATPREYKYEPDFQSQDLKTGFPEHHHFFPSE